jgi:hypothetical protein
VERKAGAFSLLLTELHAAVVGRIFTGGYVGFSCTVSRETLSHKFAVMLLPLAKRES